MPVPAKRFKLLDNDYNVPITDFLDADNTGPLSDPISNVLQDTKKGRPLIINKQIIDKQNELIRDLPNLFNQLDDPEQITAMFVSTLTGDINVSSLLGTGTARSLYDTIVSSYNVLKNYKGAINLADTSNLPDDIVNIIDSVKDLNQYFKQELSDPIAVGTVYLAILNKLHYAGYTEAFSKFLAGMPNEVAPYVAAGLIVTAANRKTPETIIDIANTPIGPKIKNVSSNLISNLAKASTLNRIREKDISQALENALDIIEPNWRKKLTEQSKEDIKKTITRNDSISSMSDIPKIIKTPQVYGNVSKNIPKTFTSLRGISSTPDRIIHSKTRNPKVTEEELKDYFNYQNSSGFKINTAVKGPDGKYYDKRFVVKKTSTGYVIAEGAPPLGTRK